MTPRERKRRLALANQLARERASLWRVYRTVGKTRTVSTKLVEATEEERALRRVRGSYQARPVLRSSEWRNIYAEVGL